MDKKQFGEEISRLKANYSHAAMTEERIQLLWDRFKGVENRVFRNAVDHLISEHTTQTLPALSKFAEAVGMFRTGTGAKMDHAPPAFDCEPCRDFGFGWIGETIVPCTCAKRVGPEECALQQKHYNNGAKFFRKGFKFTGRELPYDPSVRLT